MKIASTSATGGAMPAPWPRGERRKSLRTPQAERARELSRQLAAGSESRHWMQALLGFSAVVLTAALVAVRMLDLAVPLMLLAVPLVWLMLIIVFLDPQWRMLAAGALVAMALVLAVAWCWMHSHGGLDVWVMPQ